MTSSARPSSSSAAAANGLALGAVGLWASLAVAIAILVANWLGMRDEREDPALVEAVPVRPIPPLAR